MLNEREYKQLSDAIKCMSAYNINDHQYIDAHNVLVLLGNYTEKGEQDERGEAVSEPASEDANADTYTE